LLLNFETWKFSNAESFRENRCSESEFCLYIFRMQVLWQFIVNMVGFQSLKNKTSRRCMIQWYNLDITDITHIFFETNLALTILEDFLTDFLQKHFSFGDYVFLPGAQIQTRKHIKCLRIVYCFLCIHPPHFVHPSQ